jgi:hypothetical protein
MKRDHRGKVVGLAITVPIFAVVTLVEIFGLLLTGGIIILAALAAAAVVR